MSEKLITAIVMVLGCIGLLTHDVYALTSTLMVGIPFVTLMGIKRYLGHYD
jgi:hypothetical protein